MPSQGRQVVPVRISPELMKLIDDAIASRNSNSPDEPWTRSDFIRTAIRQKLSHGIRSRAPKKAKQHQKPVSATGC